MDFTLIYLSITTCAIFILFHLGNAGYSNSKHMLSLPVHPGLSDENVADVIDAALDVMATHRR